MRHVTLLLALACLLAAVTAVAQDEGINSLGLFFDEDFTSNCIDATPNIPFSMYWVLTGCTQESIGGFEFSWYLEPQVIPAPFIVALTLPEGALNIGDNHNLVVGLGVPLIAEEHTLLATMDVLMTVVPDEQILVMACPATLPSIPCAPVFNDGADPGLLIPMTDSTDWPECGQDIGQDCCIPVGSIGCPGPIATEPQTWSDIKALYE